MARKNKEIRDALEADGVSTNSLPVSGAVAEPSGVLVPVMDPSEVRDGISSVGKKMVRIGPPDNVMPSVFKDIISAAYMVYMRKGIEPDVENIQFYLPVYKESLIKKVLGSPQFRFAMMVRGIELGNGGLSSEQEAAISIMSTPDGRTFEQKLKKAGVAPSTWRAWLRTKKFRDVWDDFAGSILKEHENDFMVALAGQALSGDVQAIKYAFEVSGKYVPNRQQNVDAALLISQIIEIVQEEVKDLPTLQRIAARMQMVAGTPGAQRVIEDAAEAEIREIEAV